MNFPGSPSRDMQSRLSMSRPSDRFLLNNEIKQTQHSETPFKFCPRCNFALIESSSTCQYCGFQITHPTWKKVGAWILLILITYGLIKCHLRLLEGFG